MDYEEDDFFDEEFDEVEDDGFGENPLSTHSRLSAGGEFPATFDDNDHDKEEDEERDNQRPSVYSRNIPSLSSTAPLPTPETPLAGSLEEKARLAVSALIRGAVGDNYDEQVLVEEENESADEDNSFGLQLPPAFVSELYHGAEDSTESTHQSSSQEDAGNGDSSLSQEAPKVRVAAWRLNGAQAGALHGGNSPGKTTRGGAARRSDEVDPLIQSRESRRASAAKGGARGGSNDNNDKDSATTAAAAESATRASEVVVGKVRVTAAMAKLKGLDLNALAQRFNRPPEKSASNTKSGSSNNANAAKDARAKERGGDGTGGRSGRSRVEASNRPHLSRDFAKLSDAEHCTFRPRGKSPARRAAARAAGFTVKDENNNNSGVDEDAFGGFRPSGSGPTRAEIELEQSKAFVRRQDAFVAHKRKELARAAAEQAYDAVQGKKQCPMCGMVQTFEEVEMKQKACKGETCDGALYVKPRVVDMPAFLARQAAHSERTASLKQQSIDQVRAQEAEAAELAAKRRKGRSRAGGKALRDLKLVTTNDNTAYDAAGAGGREGGEAAWHEEEVYRRQKGRPSSDVPAPPRNLRTPRYLSRDCNPENETRSNFNGGSSNTKTTNHGGDRKNDAGVAARGISGRDPAHNSRSAYSGGAWSHLDGQMAEHAEALLMGRPSLGSIEELHPTSHAPHPRAHRRGHSGGGPLEFEPGARRIAAEVAHLDAQRQRARQQARNAAAEAAREKREAEDAAAEAALRASAKARSFTKKHAAARPQSGGKEKTGPTTTARITATSESKGRSFARTTKQSSSDWSRLLL